MHDVARRRRVVFAAVTSAIVLAALVALRAVLLPFVMGSLLAYVLHPLVGSITRIRVGRETVPRWAAVLGLYVTLLAALGTGLLSVTPRVVSEGRSFFVTELPSLRARAEREWMPKVRNAVARVQGAVVAHPPREQGDGPPERTRIDEGALRVVPDEGGGWRVALPPDGLEVERVDDAHWRLRPRRQDAPEGGAYLRELRRLGEGHASDLVRVGRGIVGGVKITETNILEPSGIILNQALCGRFTVPAIKHSLTPGVFTQAGFVIGTDISPATLGKLFAQTMAEAQDDTWRQLDETEQIAAAKEVDRRYQAVTLPIVLGGGLLDGINPCAFATIIFFLSYLQIARRTPREMLMVGAAFISAVFIAYLAAGLVLYEMLDQLNHRFAGIQWWLNLFFGLLALFAAWLSLRDALHARAGRLDAMSLQLPDFLKTRIRGVVRTGARARNFVIAAFISGLVISMLELACTGQVYAPIIYQIQKGKLDAVMWLVIYNLAFIAPLIAIFLLAYGGLRSETLIEFQKKHTFAVKLGLALLFLFLALFIFLGSNLIPE